MQLTPELTQSGPLVPWIPSIAGTLFVEQTDHETVKSLRPQKPLATTFDTYDVTGIQVAETMLLCVDLQVAVHVEVKVQVDEPSAQDPYTARQEIWLRESVREAERLIQLFEVIERLYGMETTS
ncbi:hypothetical protein FKP32DRAFT_1676814 [Trametes sanguinea]|nr:hypothetical protein FKP32DRAFT_1676814 [Trametes sanguinea]